MRSKATLRDGSGNGLLRLVSAPLVANTKTCSSALLTGVYPLGFRSKLLLNFYSAFMAFYIARTRLMVESRSMQRSSDVPHRDGSYIGTLLDCYLEAQKLLGAVPEMARTKHVLEYLPVCIWALSSALADAQTGNDTGRCMCSCRLVHQCR